MSILCDKQIRHLATKKEGMIEPFWERQDGDGIISYGLSSYGYDIRVGREFKIFTNVNGAVVDPKNFSEDAFIDFTGDVCVIPPNSFALARTMERFRIPDDVLTLCVGKSTYARCGIIVNVTPFEPGWKGYATLEISNTTPNPARVYAGEGIAQVLFFRGDLSCETTYADRAGKYQDQTGITLPRVSGLGRLAACMVCGMSEPSHPYYGSAGERACREFVPPRTAHQEKLDAVRPPEYSLCITQDALGPVSHWRAGEDPRTLCDQPVLRNVEPDAICFKCRRAKGQKA